ncbi:TPA: hypothetical protein ACH7Y6_005564, partial [Escherichia coli]
QVTLLQAPVIMTGASYFQGTTDMPGLYITSVVRKPFCCKMASEWFTVWSVITQSRWGYWPFSSHENTLLASKGLLRQ